MLLGESPFDAMFIKMGSGVITFEENLDILGVNYTKEHQFDIHLDNPVNAARRAMLNFSSAGMAYPGLCTEVKTYLWKTIGVPCLSYGLDTICLTQSQLKRLDAFQGTILKQVLGFNKRSHHSSILRALGVPTMTDNIQRSTVSLLRRVALANSPYRYFVCHLLAKYWASGVDGLVPGTIVTRIHNYGISPIAAFLGRHDLTSGKPLTSTHPDGIVDSLKYLLFHENFQKPWGYEHTLATLLTKAF